MAEKKNQVAKETATDGLERNWLQAFYKETVVPALIKEFNYTNVNQVPKIEKIVLNMGLGDVRDNAKSMQLAVDELKLIAGQKPVVTKARKSVANFKVREGMNVGAKVTLRGQRMYDFFGKLTCIALPRVRDFKGVSRKSFDGRGNYALGVKEQLIFPEISYDQVEKVRGFDICIVTTAKTDEEARELLKLMGMPFAKN
ncbi:MAG: 50S ribosomal protein L5 [Eubacteriales bacterium]|nr:50S ribosomal protein L5 [Christensenellaceae bacterium]MDY2751782.1 50S ribosomal protein L5 [Eubacteriales bacterium]MCI7583793.1 50S ribosomal protein L5 [Christensenellaceae bacterium]MDD6360258.1 50S ribosomal protein L5 [Christensenellaceae bacterium]MDD7092601.1 50S ribosomal protein L5 [Christensenellaceae bacterium]